MQKSFIVTDSGGSVWIPTIFEPRRAIVIRRTSSCESMKDGSYPDPVRIT